ncbi:MAG: DUF2867 domain-containing protein [Acidimicrobiia bacterium]
MRLAWPRRFPGLPPGQRRLLTMPRFTDAPHRPPPSMPAEPHIEFFRSGATLGTVENAELTAIGLRDIVADFHCVTTWSVTGVTWTGVPLAEVLASLGITEADGRYLVLQGGDHRRATLVWDDAVASDVLLATHLDGEPLGRRHGGPIRLVAPQHYGYKSVKHLVSVDLRPTAPLSLGKEHLRGRVAREERHPKWPSWLVKYPYRLLVPLTAAIAERALNRDGRVSNAEHQRHDWLIDRIAPDFTLEDVWRLPTPDGPDDFGTLLDLMSGRDRNQSGSGAAKALTEIRELLGRWFGWDDESQVRPIPGCTETTLRTRLPKPLRGSADGLTLHAPSFVPLYRTDREFAAEISNGTVHAVMQLAWVDVGDGHFTGQMGVYTKPRGRRGHAYMAFIRPFRHWIVYPALLRQVQQSWAATESRQDAAR